MSDRPREQARQRVQAFLGLWLRSGPANVIATECGAPLLASDLSLLLAPAPVPTPEEAATDE